MSSFPKQVGSTSPGTWGHGDVGTRAARPACLGSQEGRPLSIVSVWAGRPSESAWVNGGITEPVGSTT